MLSSTSTPTSDCRYCRRSHGRLHIVSCPDVQLQQGGSCTISNRSPSPYAIEHLIYRGISSEHCRMTFGAQDSTPRSNMGCSRTTHSRARSQTATSAPTDEHSEDDLSVHNRKLDHDDNGIRSGDESDALNEQPGENGFEGRFHIFSISETQTTEHKSTVSMRLVRSLRQSPIVSRYRDYICNGRPMRNKRADGQYY